MLERLSRKVRQSAADVPGSVSRRDGCWGGRDESEKDQGEEESVFASFVEITGDSKC